MSRSEEEMNATRDGCFEEAAAWHAKWQSASGLGLSAEEVDEWVRWSKDPEHKRAYDAVEFVARAKYSLEAPPLPTREELAADASDGVVLLGARRSAWRSGVFWRRAAAAVTAAAAVVAAVTFTPVLQWLNFDSTEPVHVVSTTSG